MGTITTGRPLDENSDPTDGPGLELDPEGPAAELFRDSPHPLASSPGGGIWFTHLGYVDDSETRPILLIWLAPDALELPNHIHTIEEEYFRVVEGEVTVVVEGESHRLSPDEDIAIHPGEEHAFRNDTDDFVAFYAELPWKRTADTQFTFCGLDHEGAFGSGGEKYGEPGFIHALVMGEYLSDGTKITVMPIPIQRFLWATVGRVAKAFDHRAIDRKYLRDEFWENTVEQPEL
jgi:quercetin dioxygenase-like cupin family protein